MCACMHACAHIHTHVLTHTILRTHLKRNNYYFMLIIMAERKAIANKYQVLLRISGALLGEMQRLLSTFGKQLGTSYEICVPT